MSIIGVFLWDGSRMDSTMFGISLSGSKHNVVSYGRENKGCLDRKSSLKTPPS